MKWKKLTALMLGAMLCIGAMTGCSNDTAGNSSGKKVLTIGDTTFNSSNEEPDVNPHNAYAGWACIRYGIGETLVKYSDDMELQPWLAVKWENTDPLTWKLTLRDNVKFSSGRTMDAVAVKQCLEHLIANNQRARQDLKIASIEANGQELIIKTTEPKPALLNYLGDPYGCIIDVDAGFENGIVAGTGPYIATDLKTDDHLTLKKMTTIGAARRSWIRLPSAPLPTATPWPMPCSREKFRQLMAWLTKAIPSSKMTNTIYPRFLRPAVSSAR